MPSIIRTDGIIIAWGGQVEGPIRQYNPVGVPTGSFSFKTKRGVGDAELHEVIVHVPASVMGELGFGKPTRITAGLQCFL